MQSKKNQYKQINRDFDLLNKKIEKIKLKLSIFLIYIFFFFQLFIESGEIAELDYKSFLVDEDSENIQESIDTNEDNETSEQTTEMHENDEEDNSANLFFDSPAQEDHRNQNSFLSESDVDDLDDNTNIEDHYPEKSDYHNQPNIILQNTSDKNENVPMRARDSRIVNLQPPLLKKIEDENQNVENTLPPSPKKEVISKSPSPRKEDNLNCNPRLSRSLPKSPIIIQSNFDDGNSVEAKPNVQTRPKPKSNPKNSDPSNDVDNESELDTTPKVARRFLKNLEIGAFSLDKKSTGVKDKRPLKKTIKKINPKNGSKSAYTFKTNQSPSMPKAKKTINGYNPVPKKMIKNAVKSVGNSMGSTYDRSTSSPGIFHESTGSRNVRNSPFASVGIEKDSPSNTGSRVSDLQSINNPRRPSPLHDRTSVKTNNPPRPITNERSSSYVHVRSPNVGGLDRDKIRSFEKSLSFNGPIKTNNVANVKNKSPNSPTIVDKKNRKNSDGKNSVSDPLSEEIEKIQQFWVSRYPKYENYDPNVFLFYLLYFILFYFYFYFILFYFLFYFFYYNAIFYRSQKELKCARK